MWSSVASFQLTTDWQTTDVLASGEYFQITHDNAPNGGNYIVAQVELDDASNKMRMYDSQILTVDHRCFDIIRLPKPGFYTNRRIAIKRFPTAPTLESELKRLLIPNILQPLITVNAIQLNQWSVDISVSDYQTTITNSSSSNSNTPPVQTVNLDYVADGDTNGVFYYLGTNRNTVAFTNPAINNVITLNQIDALNEGAIAKNLADRDSNSIAHTQNTQNAWFMVDLKDKTLILSRYSLKARSDLNDHNPRHWKLQASNDSLNWLDLDTQDTSTLSNGSWYSPPVANQTTGYRYFKLLQTGVNSANLNYFVLAEWELYGKLIG